MTFDAVAAAAAAAAFDLAFAAMEKGPCGVPDGTG